MRPEVCVVGSFMMDLVVRAPRRPAVGETLVGDSFEMFLGGKGFNQAIAAARAGARTAMVGRVGGDDFGKCFLEALERDGIDAAFVTRDETLGTGVGLPLVEPSGANSIVIVPRANHRQDAGDVRAAKPAIESARVVLLQLELSAPVALEAARIARAAGRTVVLNPAPACLDSLGAFEGLGLNTENTPWIVPTSPTIVSVASAAVFEGMNVNVRATSICSATSPRNSES